MSRKASKVMCMKKLGNVLLLSLFACASNAERKDLSTTVNVPVLDEKGFDLSPPWVSTSYEGQGETRVMLVPTNRQSPACQARTFLTLEWLLLDDQIRRVETDNIALIASWGSEETARSTDERRAFAHELVASSSPLLTKNGEVLPAELLLEYVYDRHVKVVDIEGNLITNGQLVGTDNDSCDESGCPFELDGHGDTVVYVFERDAWDVSAWFDRLVGRDETVLVVEQAACL